MADILNSSKFGSNLNAGYQTADFKGYLCIFACIMCSTCCHWKGLMVLEVQWYTHVVFGL
jgi:hypothetical protein